MDISIDERGIRIRPRRPAEAASSPASAAEGVVIPLPNSATKEIVQEAIDDARQAVQDAVEARKDAERAASEAQAEARQAADEAQRVTQEAARVAIEEARQALKDAGLAGATRKVKRDRVVHWGDFLTDLALIWIIASIIIKVTYKGRMQAEVKAAQATETAEAESLKRQVVEARMAAMQAQVEPHFLFNTLASIDHLIETDPKRASQMQKNLIALLRASMPTMREANDGGPRELGREIAVIRPYLEILKVRMEERLATVIDVPDGLLSGRISVDDDPDAGRERHQARLGAQARRRHAEGARRDRARQAGGERGRHGPGLRQGRHRRHRRGGWPTSASDCS